MTTYARSKLRPAPKCCLCRSPLYSRSELPTDLEALCFVCLSDWTDYKGVVLKRIADARVAA